MNDCDNLFYDTLPEDIQQHIIKLSWISLIEEKKQSLKPFSVLENFRKDYFTPLNNMSNPSKKEYSEDMLIKTWCKYLQRCMQIVNSELEYDLRDLAFYLVGLKSNEDDTEFRLNMINEELRLLTQTHYKSILESSVYVNSIYNEFVPLKDKKEWVEWIFDTSDVTQRDVSDSTKLEHHDIKSLKNMYDNYKKLNETYSTIITLINKSQFPSVVLQLVVKSLDRIMFKSIIKVIENGMIIKCKCTSCKKKITTSKTFLCVDCKPQQGQMAGFKFYKHI